TRSDRDWSSDVCSSDLIWGDVIVASVDDVLTSPACGSLRAVPQTDPNGWEGLRIFSLKQVLAARPDADGFTRVQPVGSVATKCEIGRASCRGRVLRSVG